MDKIIWKSMVAPNFKAEEPVNDGTVAPEHLSEYIENINKILELNLIFISLIIIFFIIICLYFFTYNITL